ncbi:hypothetical protein BDV25DRAFT_148398, partial [Aspergillus avenaceus]
MDTQPDSSTVPHVPHPNIRFRRLGKRTPASQAGDRLPVCHVEILTDQLEFVVSNSADLLVLM